MGQQKPYLNILVNTLVFLNRSIRFRKNFSVFAQAEMSQRKRSFNTAPITLTDNLHERFSKVSLIRMHN